jgi:RNA polymerase primary sigma factor
MGQTRGYVLYEEIDKILPAGTREAAAELDTILSELVVNSVEVMDEPRTEDSLPHPNAFDEEEFQNPNLPSIKHYIREFARIPRLTVEAEKELAKQVREARAGVSAGEVNTARLYATDGTGKPYNLLGVVMPSENPAMQKGEQAADRLIKANLWIALATATHYTNRGLGLLELVQEGNIGLLLAAREYNYHRQYRFSTYATWWVRRAIVRAVEDFSK